ncbi:WD repeat-containing protein on Y chromosome-like [Solenopsis invicta]|uniref:WD repeat-containing protein on Y chromosome-like n=1 Tax=Solenopsis invicta TaxID=13686 RepID=UPI0005960CEE|nr:WD repeat-containing protein on Y chromosome-like [Solenopsis invicta]
MSYSGISNGEEAERHEISDLSTSSRSHSESKDEFDEFDLGRKLQSPILGHHCQLPDLPTSCVPSTILDTSLLHIPVYAHLKVYDLKPVQLPQVPSILSALQLQFSEGTVLSKSSREISSTARLSEDQLSALCSARNSKIVNKKRRAEM